MELTNSASIDDAGRFLQLIDHESESFCFRSFDDSKESRTYLAKKYMGSIQQHANSLEQANQMGAGVFVVINKGGQRKDEISRIRAVFADTDGAPLDPLLVLEPHIVIQSSPNRWHVYWLVDNRFPVEQFSSVQLAIATKFDTDPSIKDLSRVMRLPGFKHCKGIPFQVQIVKLASSLPRYSIDEIQAGLGLACIPVVHEVNSTTTKPVFPLGDLLFRNQDVEQGGRNSKLLSYVGQIRSQGVPEHLILGIAMDYNLAHCKPPLDEQEVLSVVNRYANVKQSADFPNGEIVFTDILPPPRDFSIDKLLLAGKSAVLAGLGGVSKTQLAIQAAICVALGMPFLGRNTKEGSVLMLLGEEDSEEIARRFNATAKHLSISEYEKSQITKRVHSLPMIGEDMRMAKIQGGSAESTGFLTRVVDRSNALRDSSKCNVRLIVLDHAGLIHGGDFNAREDVVRTMSLINELADTTGSAVLLLAHSPKSSAHADESSASDVAGSSAWVDHSRAAFILKTMSEEEAKRFGTPVELRKDFLSLSSVKGNYIPSDQQIWLTRKQMDSYETSVLEKVDLSIPAKPSAGSNIKLRTKIHQLILEKPFLTRNRLEEYSGSNSWLGASKGKVRVELDSLIEEGLVTLRDPTEEERKTYSIKGVAGVLVWGKK